MKTVKKQVKKTERQEKQEFEQRSDNHIYLKRLQRQGAKLTDSLPGQKLGE